MIEAGEAGAGKLRTAAPPNGEPPATPPPSAPQRPGALRSLALALTSWRTASVALLSFSSGLPLGLVWIAIPDWMRNVGVDIRVVGLFTLAQAPWTFKLLWAPLMDRYVRRRGSGGGAAGRASRRSRCSRSTLALAGVGDHPDAPWVVGALALAIAFAAAIAGHRDRRLRGRRAAARRAGRRGRRAHRALPRGDVRRRRRSHHARRHRSRGRRST